jgi:uncharacterized membrane protein
MESYRYTAINIEEATRAEIDEARPIAWLSYISILFLVPFFARRNNRFALFHARQGMVLFAYDIALTIASAILAFFIIGAWVWIVGTVILAVLCIMGIAKSASGKFWKCPFWVYELAQRLPVS